MGRRPLTPDESGWILLDARAAVLSVAVTKRQIEREAAVVALSLLVPARPDIADRMIDKIEHSTTGPADWPPRACTLDLLRAARRIMSGEVELIDRDGVTVRHYSYTDGFRPPRRFLRVYRDGGWVADCVSSEELAKHVDPVSLRASA